MISSQLALTAHPNVRNAAEPRLYIQEALRIENESTQPRLRPGFRRSGCQKNA